MGSDQYMGQDKGINPSVPTPTDDYNEYDADAAAEGTEGAQDNAAQNRNQPVPRPPRFGESYVLGDAVLIAQADARRQYPDLDPDELPETLEEIHDRWMEQRNVRSLPGGREGSGGNFSVSHFNTAGDQPGNGDYTGEASYVDPD